MNKKLISMLLAVLMVISMFSGLSVSAYADDAALTTTYTMKQGDTVLKVCQSMGINYYTCKNAIMKLNGFTSDTDFRFIPVGKEIIIPVSNAAANQISSASGSTGTGSSTGTGTGTAPVVPATGDTVAYYLIPHTMLRGETVTSVCNALGINYSAFAGAIQAINGLSSLSNVKAGQTILLPVGAKPGVGTNCYAVMAHKVVSGETAYTICGSYGVSYNGNLKALQALNGTNNLNYIKAGSTFYLPVATTITAEAPTSTPPAGTGTGSTGSGSSGSGSTGSSSSGSGSTGSGSSDSTGSTKTYALKSNSGNGGVVTFYVKNKAVTAAAAGDIVTVSATPDNGYAIKTLKVVYADGSAEPKLSGNTFVMPTSDITANVEFSKGYSIKTDCSYTNGLKVLVDGIESSSAQNGAQVLVASNNPALAIDGQVEIYKTENGAYVKSVAAGKSFDMPGYDITVRANMKTVTTYGFFKSVVDSEGKSANNTGSFVLQVNGSAVSRAAEGTTVTVLASPAVGYAISTIEVYESNKDGELVNKLSVRGESFTMPANPAHVVVSFAATSSKINIAAHSHGLVKAYSEKECTNVISYAETEKTVYIKAESIDVGFTAQKPVVTRTVDGTLVEVKDEGSGVYSFTMPGGGAEVQPQFVGSYREVSVEVCDESMVPITASDVIGIMINDVKVATSDKYPEGSVLRVREVSNVEAEFVSFEVVNTATGAAVNDLTKTLNESGTVLVPDYAITIRAFFKFNTVEVGGMFFGDKWMAMWVAEDNFNKQVESYIVGRTGILLVAAEVDNIELVKITNKATGAVIGWYDDVTGANGDVVVVPNSADPNSYTDTAGFAPTSILTIGVNAMPAEGVNVEIKMGNPNSAITLAGSFVINGADGAALTPGDYNDYNGMLKIYGASYSQDMSQGFTRLADIGDTEYISVSSAGAELGLVLTSIKYVDGDGEHYVEAVNGVCTITVPKSDVTITEAKTINNYVKTSDIKTDLSNVSVKFYHSVNNAQEVTFYLLGEEVWFRISVKDKYTLDENSIKVVNLDDGSEITVGSGINDIKNKGNGYYAFTLTSRNIRIEAKATNLRTIKFTGNMLDTAVMANVESLTNGKVTWTLDAESNTNDVYVANAGDTFKITFKKDVTVPQNWSVTGVAAADVKVSGQTVYFTVPAGAETADIEIDYT